MARRRKKSSRYGFALAVAGTLVLFVLLFRLWGHRGSNTELELPPLPEGFSAHGIDISHYQGDVDWTLFHAHSDSLISFVYCKATEGVSLVDSKWNHNREQLLSLQIPHGAYHFFVPSSDASTQAQHFLKHYRKNALDLPPVLDVETEGKSDEMLLKSVRIWLHEVERITGLKPVIYTSHHFYRTKFKGRFPGYKFWIANYNPTVNGLEDPQIIHWQYSDNGRVPGIASPVDMNFSKITY